MLSDYDLTHAISSFVIVVVGHRAAVVLGHRAAMVAGHRVDVLLQVLGTSPCKGGAAEILIGHYYVSL